MASLNIRLSAEDEKAVASLREDRINVSDLVRQAIQDASRKRKQASQTWTKARIAGLVAKINAIPVHAADWEGINFRDRKAVSDYIRKKQSARLGKLADLG